MSKPKQSKTETVLAMLTRPHGASLEAICKTTDWQQHSARAVLSGFRKAGHKIERRAPEGGKTGGSVYRIIVEPEAAE